MDTSLQYIKFCEKAEEMQIGWLPQEWDFIFCNSAGCLCSYSRYKNLPRLVGKPNIPASWSKFKIDHIWLPRQDQLQEMVKRSDYSPKLHDGNLLLVSIFKDWVKDNWQSLLASENSMEQLWLAFVMEERWNKYWNGENWVKEDNETT